MRDPDLHDPTPGGGGDDLGPAERELEAALADLRPAGAGLDPTAAAFEAGRRVGEAAGRGAAGRSAMRWRLATAALFAVAAASVGLNARQHGQARVQLVYVPTTVPAVAPATATSGFVPSREPEGPPAAPPTDLLPAGNLLALRTAALEHGVDALPATSFGLSSAPIRVGDRIP